MANNSATPESSPKRKGRFLTPQKSKQRNLAIRALLLEQVGISEISRRLKVSRTHIYTVKSQLANESAEPAAVTQADLGWTALKASNPWGSTPQSAPLTQANCVACLQVMWTDSPKNDLCESCMYQAMTDAATASLERDIPRFANPFAENAVQSREVGALRGKLS